MTCRQIVLPTAVFAAVVLWISAAAANPLTDLYLRGPGAFPLALQPLSVEETVVAPDLRRQLVSYPPQLPAGTVVVDTEHTYLYYVLGDGKAIRYGIGVGRDGFTWAETEAVTRKAEWPDWAPPAEMIAPQPYLSRWMAGGEGNPLGARAIYLGNTVYRIHGTNMPDTIGQGSALFDAIGPVRRYCDDAVTTSARRERQHRWGVLQSQCADRRFS